ncbi:peptidyl-prolyl cis-trans isomerase [Anaeromyxobacter diazotrophicus]|uniref:Periplasmic chaperone PpiD n=1 Tax=Anaeromyxobacter diazotrophicus TaxID=2590199 RepID=A0A7I9VKX6_9BACT|nr:peptidyl-prolyl cis-trans isomerase [Anaeromyxobacter diazotrophicus]GEJ57076.1 hypothetical protein AMYX_18170 [Anaeromyxobacter diazotrophicus]
MNNRRLLATLLLLVSPAAALAEAKASSSGVNAYFTRDGKSTKVPLFAPASATLPVAEVENEAITLGELSKVLAGAHGAMGDAKSAGKKDFAPLLDRMIDARLLVIEARAMGIPELPELKKAVAEHREQALREMVKAKVLAPVRPDQMAVERAYRETVKEWKVKSVLFPAEADAQAMSAAVAAGKSFDELAKKAVADKKAKGGEPAVFLPRKEMLPQVLEAVQPLDVGAVSAPVKVGEGFAVLKVEAFRYPENPKARQEAEKRSLTGNQQLALARFYKGLVKKYAKVDEKLLAKLDFEAAKPGFAAMKKDERPLVQLKGEKPITVADLAKGLEGQFYHGLEGAIREKRVNAQKASTLDGLVSPRIVVLEARRQGLDKSAAYRQELAEYERSTTFGTFLEKTIAPSIKVTDEEEQKYYEQHKAEFSYPAMYKLESVAFRDVKDAQAALTKLRSGTDYKWFKANAERQVPDELANPSLDGSTVAATTIPADLAQQLAGTKKGDYRLYAAKSAQYHVVHVSDAIATGAQPFAEVKGQIAKKLFAEHVEAALKDYAGKLRKAHPVKVYLTKIGS